MKSDDFIEHQRKQEELGLSGIKYCKEYNIPYSTWCYWKRKNNATKPGQAFIELAPESSNSIKISHPKGFEVHLTQDFDESILRKALQVLVDVKS